MKIEKGALEEIQAHGAEGYPHEICGIMIGPPGDGLVTEVRRAGNIIGQPRSRWSFASDRTVDRYEMDPLDQIRVDREARLLGLDIVGYYHSHPDHPAKASMFDADQSYAGYVYVIVSVEKGKPVDINAFVTEKDRGPFRPEPLEVVGPKPV
jgi:proteasome lid subunit RPN8/RPN11